MDKRCSVRFGLLDREYWISLDKVADAGIKMSGIADNNKEFVFSDISFLGTKKNKVRISTQKNAHKIIKKIKKDFVKRKLPPIRIHLEKKIIIGNKKLSMTTL